MTVNTMSAAQSGAQVDGETFRMYYTLQYTRIAQHENGRLQVSNYIVAASVVALGLLALPKSGLSRLYVAAPVAVAIVNLLAILYARQSRRWVKFHQARAHLALEQLSPALAALQERADSPGKPDSNRNPFRSQLLIPYLHGVIAITAVLLIIGWGR